MAELVCNTCGLPKDLCVCDQIARESQKITVKLDNKKFGKKYTVISGFSSDINIKDLVKKLKGTFACGGTVKNDVIELQGDHRKNIKQELAKLGFSPESIEVK